MIEFNSSKDMHDQHQASVVRPLYVVTFDGAETLDQPSAAGLDPRLVGALPLLFTVLELPRSGLEATYRGSVAIYWDHMLEHPHSILLVPWPWPDRTLEHLHAHGGVYCLATDAVRDAVAQACVREGFRFVDAGERAGLAPIWTELGQRTHLALQLSPGPLPRSFVGHIDTPLRAIFLSTIRAARLIDDGGRPETEIVLQNVCRRPIDLDDALDAAMQARGRVQFAYDFERQHGAGVAPTRDQFGEGFQQAIRTLRAPLVLGIVPDTATRGVDDEALEVLVAHRALAVGGLGFSFRCPGAVWDSVDELHQRMVGRDPHRPRALRGKEVCRRVREIGEGILSSSPQLQDVLTHASRSGGSPIYAFSDLPMEWCAVPGRTDPLCYVRPVIRRPVYPLTAAIQAELMPRDLVDLRSGLRIACLECVAPDDPLFRHADRVAAAIQAIQGEVKIQVRRIQTLSRDAFLRACSENHDCNVFVVLAHGVADSESRATGLLVGTADVVSPGELPFLPPIIVLSSCNTSVRGRAWANLADSCLTRGATTVISASVPIMATRNRILLTRFFRLLGAAIEGLAPHDTVLDVWHHAQSTHVAHDILDTWGRLQSRYGEVEYAFKHERFVGRLRVGHIIEDTVTVLEEVLQKLGIRGLPRWLEHEGYSPESLFYSIAGWPDLLWASDPRASPVGRTGRRGISA